MRREPVHLVEAVAAHGGRGGVFFQGRVADGVEGGVVDALEVPFVVELVDAVEDVHVGLVGGSDDKLGGLADGAVGGAAGEVVDPFHRG